MWVLLRCGLLLLIAVANPSVTQVVLVVLLLIGCFLLYSWLLRQGGGRTLTPWERLRAAAEPRDQGARDQRKPFDVFLSYKSEDSHIVRRVADSLLASGVRVWFAEYCVLIDDQRQFQEAIDTGIDNCSFAIAFTNDRYSHSEHCRYELTRLLDDRHCGRERLVQVKLDDEPLTHPECPSFDGVPSVTYRGRMLEVMEFIESATGFEVRKDPYDRSAPRPRIYENRPYGYSLDPSDWMVVHDTMHPQFGLVAEFEHVSLRGQMTGNIIVQQCDWAAPRPLPLDARLDDRACFLEALGMARWYLGPQGPLGSIGATCRGVHLFFTHGYSHLGLTYEVRNSFARRYSIVLPHPNGRESIEFAFVFDVFSDFPDFCRQTWRMEHVVETFRWHALPQAGAPSRHVGARHP